MNRDDAHVLDMLLAARRAVEALEGHTLDEFLDDWRLQSIVQHQLMVLGEAVKRLSAEFRERHSELPWKAIAGQRDVVVHQYDEVDFEALWDVVKESLPPLIRFLEAIAPKQDGD